MPQVPGAHRPMGLPPEAAAVRPERLVLVCGTATDVGKTWVCARLLVELRNRGVSVSARKPAQSIERLRINVAFGTRERAGLVGSLRAAGPFTS